MSPTETIVLPWLAFAGTHLGLASMRLRSRPVGRLRWLHPVLFAR